MPDYVLIALVGDTATRNAAALADRLSERLPPTHRLSQDDVKDFRLGTGQTIVFFGHGLTGGLGKTTREIVCTAENLGSLFSGSRMFVYACDTLSEANGYGSRLGVVTNHTAMGIDETVET